MTIEVIGIITLALGLAAIVLGPAYIVLVFLASTLLGASAAIVLTSVGYANVQPANLLLGVTFIVLATTRGFFRSAARSLTFPNEGFWLTLTACYGALSAVLLPRVFAGATYVFAIARTEAGPGLVAIPLAPTSGNFTQPVYFIGDVLCFLCFYAYASTPTGMKAAVRAILVCTAVNLVFAAADLTNWVFHTGDLLAVLRNANYRMLDEATIDGFKRIVGSFPEASTFAYFTLGWFAFCTRLWLAGIAKRYTGPLALLSFLTLLLATSSTGYAGLTAFLSASVLVSVASVLTRPISQQRLAFTALVPVLGGAILVGSYLYEPIWNTATTMADKTVFNKLSTQSGVERENWNRQALTNFGDTDGLGAGVGSVRASSFPVAVLGNIGVIGAFTYGCFVISVLFARRGRWREFYPASCQSAARWACFTQLVGASVSGSFIDLGLPFFIFAGIACAGPQAVRRVSNYPSRADRFTTPAAVGEVA